MSFDSEFDFSAAKTKLDTNITTFDGHISAIDSELAVLANISGHDALVDPKETNLTHTRGVYVTMKTNRSDTKTEIEAVEALSSGNKTSLYDFWTNVLSGTNETKQDWMARMLFNYSGLITDADNVQNDGNLSALQKTTLAELVCAKFPIDRKASQIKGLFA